MASLKGTSVVKRKKSWFEGIAKEEVTLTWRIVNFKEVVEVAAAMEKFLLGKLRFFVGIEDESPSCVGSSGIPLAVTLKLLGSQRIDDPASKIRLELKVDGSKKNVDIFIRCFGETSGSCFDSNGIRKLSKEKRWGWNIFHLSEIDRDLEEDGSLNFNLEITTYLVAGKNLTVLNAEDEPANALTFSGSREETLNSLGSLLGDAKTSDVQILVMDGEKEVGKFFCHTAILSVRSPVFRAMFEQDEMTEKQEGLVKIVDVSVEVMSQFLTFLYSGRLQDKRKEANSNPIWVKMLPEMVYVADKYAVGDLKDFCEANLHRAVTEENAVEVFKLARRHGLVKAEAKLRAEFAKNIDALLESVLK